MGRFPYRTLDELKTDIAKFKINLKISEDITKFYKPVHIPGYNDNYTIQNRIGIHPMEGFDADETGSPSLLTNERYKRFGSSGAGIVWFEATAVVPEGRSNPHQLMINQDNIDKFKGIISSFDEGRTQLFNQFNGHSKKLFKKPIKILQLTHSGRYSNPGGVRYPYRFTNLPELDSAMHIPHDSGEIVTDEYLDELKVKYLNCIKYAVNAGFDGVDIKSCHGYLISEILGGYTRASSKYGGESIEKRGKFLLDIIREATHRYPKHIITLRINLFDVLAYPYGFSTKELDEHGIPSKIDLGDMHILLQNLSKSGVRLISFSAGNPYYNPYLSRPYDRNAFNGPEAPEHPLFSYNRIVHLIREINAFHPELITIATAFSWFRQFAPYLAAGEINRKSFHIAGFGRMAFAYPQFPVHLYNNGKIDPNKVCIACSKCTELMRMNSATGCVIRNPKYSKIYKEAYKEFKKKK
jgi:2,4-dienoyl-CoA reductase (NADPH2)